MDPLSIATGCVSIAVAVPTLMMRIMAFVAEVKGARKDLDGVHRELSSLQLCLNALRIEDQTGRCKLPADIVTQTCQKFVNIETTMNQISNLLDKLGSGRLGRRIQWATTEKEEVAKLRSSLESNKTALEISLTLGSITMLVEQNTKAQAHHDQTVELTQMTRQLTVQSAATDGKVDLLLQRRDNSKNIENIQAALAELKEELVTLSASSGKQSVVERLAQLMTDHAVFLLDTESIRDSTEIVKTVRDIQKMSNTDQDSGLLVPAGESATCYGCSDKEEELRRLEATLSKQERWFSKCLKKSERKVERVFLEGRNYCSSLEKRYDEDIRMIEEEAIDREKALKATADHLEKLYDRSIAWMRTERTACGLSLFSEKEFPPWDRAIMGQCTGLLNEAINLAEKAKDPAANVELLDMTKLIRALRVFRHRCADRRYLDLIRAERRGPQGVASHEEFQQEISRMIHRTVMGEDIGRAIIDLWFPPSRVKADVPVARAVYRSKRSPDIRGIRLRWIT